MPLPYYVCTTLYLDLKVIVPIINSPFLNKFFKRIMYLKQYGRRHFSVPQLTLWSNLPFAVRHANSMTTFQTWLIHISSVEERTEHCVASLKRHLLEDENSPLFS